MITENGKPQDNGPRKPPPDRSAPLHRLGMVREREGISQRSVARCLGISVSDVAEQERESADIRLGDLYKWRDVLNVPLVELLVDPGNSLSPPVMIRAQLVRVMKTALSIRERARRVPIQRMAQNLLEQLIGIMPELRDVQAWPTVGSRRTHGKYGRIVERIMPDSFLEGPADEQ